VLFRSFEVRSGSKGEKPSFRLYKNEMFRYTQCRPFMTRDVSLRDIDHLDTNDPQIELKLTSFLTEQARLLVEECQAESTLCNKGEPNLLYHVKDPKKVLVRLRVEHSGFNTINPQRFGAQFLDRVANPQSMLFFHKKRKGGLDQKASASRPIKQKKGGLQEIVRLGDDDEAAAVHIEDLISESLTSTNKDLVLLSKEVLAKALDEFVSKTYAGAIMDTVAMELESKKKLARANKDIAEAQAIRSYLCELSGVKAQDDGDGVAARMAEEAAAAPAPAKRKAVAVTAKGKGRGKAAAKAKESSDDDDDGDGDGMDMSDQDQDHGGGSTCSEDETPVKKRGSAVTSKAKKAPAKAKAPAVKAPVKRTARAAAKKASYVPSDEEGSDDDETPSPLSARGRGASSSATASSARAKPSSSSVVVDLLDDDDDISDGSDNEDPSPPRSRARPPASAPSSSSSSSRGAAAPSMQGSAATAKRGRVLPTSWGGTPSGTSQKNKVTDGWK